MINNERINCIQMKIIKRIRNKVLRIAKNIVEKLLTYLDNGIHSLVMTRAIKQSMRQYDEKIRVFASRNKSTELSKEQEKEIIQYWYKYVGCKIDLNFHRMSFTPPPFIKICYQRGGYV